jgi:DNA (cytosine-5)-methyltransferase 1
VRHLDLFSGIGGFALAAQMVWGDDYENIAFCDNNEFCQEALRKNFPGCTIIGDVKLLSWVVDDNDGMCYNELCETRSNEPPTCETLSLHAPETRQGLLSNPARIVERNLFSDRQKPSGQDASALGNADTSSCAEATRPTPAAEDGCAAKATRIGKAATDTTEAIATKKLKSPNGAGECSRGINTPASNADASRRQRGNSTRTTSKNGRSIPNSGLTSQTEEPYAKSATQRYIGRERIDLLTAGVPCQPASCAGQRRGTADDRWLWPETYRIIREAQPTWVILENVRGLLSLEGGLVFKSLLLELETFGYEVGSFIIPACSLNAPHRRDRCWIVAHRKFKQDDGERGDCQRGRHGMGRGTEAAQQDDGKADNYGSKRQDSSATDSQEPRLEGRKPAGNGCAAGCDTEHAVNAGDTAIAGLEREKRAGVSGRGDGLTTPDWTRDWREVAFSTCIHRVDDGLSRRLVRLPSGRTISRARWRTEALKAYGNAIVPAVAAEIMQAIKDVDAMQIPQRIAA